MIRTDSVAFRWAVVIAAVTAAPTALVAQTQPASGMTVAEVIPQGNRLTPAERITGVMQTKAGRPFSQVIAQEDVARLMQMKAFTDVRIDTQVTPENRLLVLVVVSELPTVVQEIVYNGANHIKDKELEELTGLRRGLPLNPAANKAACQAILRKYQEQGRFFSSVTLKEGDKPGDARVVFDIVEGPIVKISSISFVGQEFASSGRLKTQITSSRSYLGIGGTFIPPLLEADTQKVEDYYRALGYQDVRVDRELVWSKDYSSVKVVFHIDEGPRYRVRTVQVNGNKALTTDRLLNVTDLKPGEFYDKAVIQAGVKNIRDLYGLEGRMVGVRETVYQTGPGELDLHYEVQERPPMRVGQILIIGNERTKENVIRRQIPLYPGQILTVPSIQQGEANLARLGIFEVKPDEGIRPSISILDPDSDTQFKDLLVHVQETSTGSFMLGVGVNSDAGLSGSIVLNERNFDITRPPLSFADILNGAAFRGAGQEFRLEAVPGNRFQRYTASFREPSLFDTPYSLGVSGYYYQRGFLEYNENRLGTRVTLGRQLTQFWSADVSVRAEQVDVRDVSVFAPIEILQDLGQSFVLGLRGGVARDSRDSYLRPTTGGRLEASFEQVLGDYTFPLLTGEYSRFFTTYQRYDGSGRQVLAMRSQVAYAGPDAPVFERLYAGGFRSLRGFQFRGVGPFVGDFNIGGNFSWLNSIEYQIPLVATDSIYFVTFLDSGTVETDVSIQNYRAAAGFGFRLQVPMLGPVPIALDFAFPLSKGPGDRDQLFSFWLGFFN